MSESFIPAAKPLIGPEEREAVDRVLRSGMLAQGPEVQAFEEEFAAVLVDGRECVAVSSGTSGLHLGLIAAGIGPGDEVIVPSFTFAATANAVVLTGATPVFADIEADTFCLDPVSVESVISARTAAILAVHLYGQPADMEALGQVAQRHGLRLFEDAAQAHGASLNGKRVGTFGDFAMFSLYPTKNMTSGEGGMVSCGSPRVGRSVRLLRNQGMERRYENEIIGFNNRMTDIHAAIGRVQLAKITGWTARRQANARFFDANLVGITTPPIRTLAEHVYHQYTIRVSEDRDGFAKALREEYAVGSDVYYPTPVHHLAPFRQKIDLPVTDGTTTQVLSLPVHPSLTSRQMERIVEAVNSVAQAGI